MGNYGRGMRANGNVAILGGLPNLLKFDGAYTTVVLTVILMAVG
jgi:hypothetical protein